MQSCENIRDSSGSAIILSEIIHRKEWGADNITIPYFLNSRKFWGGYPCDGILLIDEDENIRNRQASLNLRKTRIQLLEIISVNICKKRRKCSNSKAKEYSDSPGISPEDNTIRSSIREKHLIWYP
jgi:hypothetical protein